jgi:lipopolysaccharide/colanic/teichoic acid biosynthesis glycosyltransferase
MRRLFDILFSLTVLILTIPLLIVIALAVMLSSRGPVFFLQTRIGKNREPFKIYKFRSMRPGRRGNLRLTVADDDRVTAIGKLIRALKLDELPQFLNVLKGEMAIVGYRPEVPEYVEKYEPWMHELFEYKPGLTDPASIEFRNEPEILAKSDDPEGTYVREIMPAKLRLSLDYLRNRSFGSDLRVILRTARLVMGG